jgi:transposase InsO family protein
MDRTSDGRRLKFLNVVDEFTRECLAIFVGRRIGALEVIAVLAALVQERGAPQHVRSDNGPEFIAVVVRRWLESQGIATLYIEPGSPWENAYCESFNSRLRDGLLNREEFASELEAKVLSAEWRQNYKRAAAALGVGGPDTGEYAARWRAPLVGLAARASAKPQEP